MTQHFALEIDSNSARDGWMNCWLVVDGQRHHLDATSVFPPFGDLLQFARALAINSLPYEFFWEEEGHGAKFQALPLVPENAGFRLRIDHDGEIVVDAEFDRKQIMLGLLETLRGVALDCPGAESEWDFPYFLIESIERDLVQDFVPVAEAKKMRTANFVFGHYGGYGGQVYPAFSIWIDHKEIQYMDMKDIPRFWWMWFDLLEKIARGDLPTEAVFHPVAEDLYDDHAEHFLPLGHDTTVRFQVQALPDSQDFQLQVVRLVTPPGAEQVLLKGVFARRQFVEKFTTVFNEFLQTSYPAFLQSAENKFDLRILPLDRLTTL